MDDFPMLVPGARFRIVDTWNSYTNENPDGRMDCYLGTVATVRDVCAAYLIIEEDNGVWCWNQYCVAEILDDEPDFAVADDAELQRLLGGVLQ